MHAPFSIINRVCSVSNRSASKSDERHFALYLVSGQRDSSEDIAQLFVHVHFGLQTLQVLWLLQGLRECRTFTWHHLDVHTQGLEVGMKE